MFPRRRGNIDVRGRWVRAQIVGVVAQQVLSAQFVASREFVGDARAWTSASVDTSEFTLPTSRYAGLFVVADGLDQVGDVRAGITRLGYSTSAPENLIETVRRYLRVVEIVLAGIGLIALMIAALGITNALLAAIRERRREIGVLKAIGARDRDIRRLFLIEAGLTGLVGGLLGTVVGYLIARVLGFGRQLLPARPGAPRRRHRAAVAGARRRRPRRRAPRDRRRRLPRPTRRAPARPPGDGRRMSRSLALLAPRIALAALAAVTVAACSGERAGDDPAGAPRPPLRVRRARQRRDGRQRRAEQDPRRLAAARLPHGRSRAGRCSRTSANRM